MVFVTFLLSSNWYQTSRKGKNGYFSGYCTGRPWVVYLINHPRHMTGQWRLITWWRSDVCRPICVLLENSLRSLQRPCIVEIIPLVRCRLGGTLQGCELCLFGEHWASRSSSMISGSKPTSWSRCALRSTRRSKTSSRHSGPSWLADRSRRQTYDFRLTNERIPSRLRVWRIGVPRGALFVCVCVFVSSSVLSPNSYSRPQIRSLENVISR